MVASSRTFLCVMVVITFLFIFGVSSAFGQSSQGFSPQPGPGILPGSGTVHPGQTIFPPGFRLDDDYGGPLYTAQCDEIILQSGTGTGSSNNTCEDALQNAKDKANWDCSLNLDQISCPFTCPNSEKGPNVTVFSSYICSTESPYTAVATNSCTKICKTEYN